jgi:hypothetical protein
VCDDWCGRRTRRKKRKWSEEEEKEEEEGKSKLEIKRLSSLRILKNPHFSKQDT